MGTSGASEGETDAAAGDKDAKKKKKKKKKGRSVLPNIENVLRSFQPHHSEIS